MSVALNVLRIPSVVMEGGKSYNNARIIRRKCGMIGEEAFRELVWQQSRENKIDGEPRSRVRAFMAKLNRYTDHTGGTPRPGGAA